MTMFDARTNLSIQVEDVKKHLKQSLQIHNTRNVRLVAPSHGMPILYDPNAGMVVYRELAEEFWKTMRDDLMAAWIRKRIDACFLFL